MSWKCCSKHTEYIRVALDYTNSPVPVVSDVIERVGSWYQQIWHIRLQLLTHLCNCVIKYSPCVIRSFPNQFDLPGSGGETQVCRFQLHHLTGDLREDCLRPLLPAEIQHLNMTQHSNSLHRVIAPSLCERFDTKQLILKILAILSPSRHFLVFIQL